MKGKGITGLRWVAPAGIHLTLKFLGDTPEEQTGSIGSVLAQAVHQHGRFRLGLGKPGFFPEARAPRVCWLGLTGELDRLGLLQSEVDRSISALGFPPERRSFEAHLTLGRVVDGATAIEKRKLVEAASITQAPDGQLFWVESVSLMQSQLLAGGARYNRLCEAKLNQSQRL
jgi:2'-5' RNA ligase